MAHCAGGARARGGDVHQRWVHADQDNGSEWARCVSGAARGGLWRENGCAAHRYEARAETEARHREFVSRWAAEGNRGNEEPRTDFWRGVVCFGEVDRGEGQEGKGADTQRGIFFY